MTKKPVAKKSTAVAVHKPTPPAAPVTFLEFLDRASRDPDFDAEKFAVILAAKERQDARDREAAFDEAMAQAQAAMQPIRADMENKQTKSKYASDVALDRAIRPIYSRYGFSLSFGTGENPPPDHVRVTCRIACAGHHRLEHFDIPADGKGAKGGDVMTKTHAAGSAASYGQRYLLLMIFNLKVIKKNGEPMADDDGNAAGGQSVLISEKQSDQITALILETKSDITRFLKYFGVESVSDLPAPQFQRAIDSLNAKKAKAVSA